MEAKLGQTRAPGSDTDTSTLAHDDHSIYVHMDGVRTSAAWRVADYAERDALSREQQEDLAQRFDLPREVLEELSILVGNSLDVDSLVNLVEIRRSTAVERAE